MGLRQGTRATHRSLARDAFGAERMDPNQLGLVGRLGGFRLALVPADSRTERREPMRSPQRNRDITSRLMIKRCEWNRLSTGSLLTQIVHLTVVTVDIFPLTVFSASGTLP